MSAPANNQVAEFPRAGLPRRLAALLYDSFLVAAIWMLVGYLLQLIFGPDTSQLVDGQVLTDPLQGNILFVLMVASSSGFYLWFWTRSGQTLGMLAWHMRVVDLNNQPLSLQRAAVRWLAAWPAFFLLGIGYLWLLLDPNGDAVHDKISASKVIAIPKAARGR